MWNTLPPLLTASYWFGIQPLPLLGWVQLFLLALMIALTLAAVAAFTVLRRSASDKYEKRIWVRSGQALITASWTGFILLFFVWQQIPILSMRVFFVVWFAVFVYWGSRIWVYAKRVVPEIHATQEKRLAYEKWLPKRKS